MLPSMTNAQIMADRLADLLRREREEMAEFLIALAEFDRTRGWIELGHSSLFYFLHRELGLSKGAAFYRKTAAELIQKFPEVIEPLRDGRLCITSIVHVAKVLTAENRHEMLPRFFQRSRRDARAVAASVQPTAAPHRVVVTSVPDAAAAPADSPRPADAAGLVQPAEPTAAPTADGQVPARAARRDCAEPLTAALSRLHITVSQRFLDKLEAARAALSHEQPGGNAESVLEAGLDLILERDAKRKGLVKNPRKATANPNAESATPRVPAAVKRQVWSRDGGKCQWPLEGGGVCGSRQRVQFDHVVPRALGGRSTKENVRLLCRFHNDLAARRAFGAGWMNRFTRDPAAVRNRPGS